MTRSLLCISLFFVMTLCTQAGVVPALPSITLPAEALAQLDEPKAEAEDPTAIADRISKTTKSVGEKLADRDTGLETQKSQEQIRKDIDALIQALENQSPPMGGGGGGGGGKSGSPPPPMGGGGGASGSKSNPSGDSPSGSGSSGRRPRGNRGQGQPMPAGGKASEEPMGGKDQPMPAGGNASEEPMGGQPMGKGDMKLGGAAEGQPGNNPGVGGGNANPTLPLAETVAKEFWGHLPEQPRQRMLQFFREQYMSRYKDLLPQYYSSLAEKEKKNKK